MASHGGRTVRKHAKVREIRVQCQATFFRGTELSIQLRCEIRALIAARRHGSFDPQRGLVSAQGGFDGRVARIQLPIESVGFSAGRDYGQRINAVSERITARLITFIRGRCLARDTEPKRP
jgi:hypothetical protein